MPPRDGFTVAYFLTVADIDRSARILPGPSHALGRPPTRFSNRSGKDETHESTRDDQGFDRLMGGVNDAPFQLFLSKPMVAGLRYRTDVSCEPHII
jgi:hypothetical protein